MSIHPDIDDYSLVGLIQADQEEIILNRFPYSERECKIVIASSLHDPQNCFSALKSVQTWGFEGLK